MRIVNLMEDTPGASGCAAEHGLSFYIETAHHKLLMDTGATEAFLANAEKKGIDLSAVDTVILSHGHYDHTGGVLAFAARNPHAKIYVQRGAVGAFYTLKYPQPKYIGMDAAVARLPQVEFLAGDRVIDGELSLFTGVTGRRLWPAGNRTLQVKTEEGFCQDDFAHEQYLVLSEGERHWLLSGCAHNGILNILDAYRARYGGEPSHVISGFHTVQPAYTAEDEAILRQTARELAGMKTRFYSGHCTGEYPMGIFREILGEKLTVLHSGDEIL